MATINDYARMCKANYSGCTINCPLSYMKNGRKLSCGLFMATRPAEASEIIEKWCDEHPQKTYLQDFMEKFPKTSLNAFGQPLFPAHYIYGDGIKWGDYIPEEESEKYEATYNKKQ